MCLTVIFYSPKRNFIIYIPKGRCNLRNVINSRTAVHQVTVNSLSMGPGKGTSFTAQCVLGCHVILLSPPQCILTISWPLLEFQSVTGPANGKTRTLGSCPRTRIPSCWSGFHANPPASYSICSICLAITEKEGLLLDLLQASGWNQTIASMEFELPYSLRSTV